MANNLTLGGGTLSAGGNAQTYSGTVNVSGNSIVNMSDSNAVLTGTARNITLSGVVSGSNSLTIDSNNTVSAGNQLGGTLTINNAGTTWSGDLLFNRGTVTIAPAVSPIFTNNVTFNSFGRNTIQGVNAGVLNRTGTLTYAAAAVGELGVDNTSGTLTSNYTINQTGLTTVGAGAAVRLFLADTASALEISNVTLGGTASISVAGGDADSFVTISGVISDGGSGFGLNVNDDQGAWAQTNTLLRLTGANTFSGGLSLSEGTLEFSTVSNTGGPASNLGQGSSITLNGGSLRFIGGASEATNRNLIIAGSSTLDASGTGGATMTYNTIDPTATGASLTLTGTGEGFFNGTLVQSGTTADITKNGTGTWTLNAAQTTADDIIVNAGLLIINAAAAHAGDDLFIRGGSTVRLTQNGALTATMDDLLISDNAAGDAGSTLDLFNTTGHAVDAITIGTAATGNITSTGGVGSLSHGGALTARQGTISANVTLLGAGAFTQDTVGATFTMAGTGTGQTGGSNVNFGTLILDYSTNNNGKLPGTGALAMNAGTLTLNGNGTLASAETAPSFNAGSRHNVINLNSNSTGMTLNLGAITRNQGSSLNINYSGTGAMARTTTTAVAGTGGIIGGYVTLNQTDWAEVTGSTPFDLTPLATYTSQNDVSLWAAGQHVTNTGTLSGTVTNTQQVHSVRLNAGTANSLNIASTGVLQITSGGILLTSGVGGNTVVSGGRIMVGPMQGNIGDGTNDLVLHKYAAGDLTVSSSIKGAATGVVLVGPGTFALSGQNSFRNRLTINGGQMLEVSGGNAIGDRAEVLFDSKPNTQLVLLANETVGGLNTGSTQTGNLVNLNGFALTVNYVAALSSTMDIAGSGTFVKTGGSNANMNRGAAYNYTGGMVVNSGLLQISGASTFPNVNSIAVNPTGALLIDNNGTTVSTARLADAAPITLGSFGNGSFGGLASRNDQDSSRTETVGPVTLAGSASSIVSNATGGTSSASTILLTSLSRGVNRGTVYFLGRNLGLTGGNNGRVTFTTAPTLTGGGGAAGTRNVSILPWAVAATDTVSIAAPTVNPLSFATVGANGIRPLVTSGGTGVEEYQIDAAGYAASADPTENLRFATDAAGLASKTFNAMVIDASAGARTISGGAGNTLTLTSGAILLTAGTTPANAITLDGYQDIAVGGGNEYIVSVWNTQSTINTNLSTVAASLTKWGTGTLLLPTNSSYSGGTWFNQGTIQVSNFNQLGTGGLNFFGGTLRWATGFTDDPSARTVTLGFGGGTFDTNGNDVTVAGAIGNGGNGSLNKAGTGILTLQGTNTYTGATIITTGTVSVASFGNEGAAGPLGNQPNGYVNPLTGSRGSVILNGGTLLHTGAAETTNRAYSLSANSTIDLSGAGDVVFDVSSGPAVFAAGNLNLALVGTRGATFNDDVDLGTGTLTLGTTAVNNGNAWVLNGVLSGNLVVNGGTLTLGVQHAIGRAVTLGTVPGASTINMGSFDQAAASLAIYGTGSTGTSVATINGTGTIILGGNITHSATGNALGAVINPNLNLGAASRTVTVADSTGAADDLTISGAIAGDAGITLTKAGAGLLVLGGNSTFPGGLIHNAASVVRLTHNNAAGTGTISLQATDVILELANGLTVANAAAVSDTGNNKIIRLQSGATAATYSGTMTIAETTAGNFDLSADTAGTLTVSGVISGAVAGGVSKVGLGTVVLTAANTYTGATAVNAGTLQLGSGGTTGSLNTASAISVAASSTFAVNRSDLMTQGTDFSGAAISGAGRFAQIGSGTTVLNAANSFSGGVTIAAGTLSVGADNHLGAAANDVDFDGNGATLAVTGTFSSSRNLNLNLPNATDNAVLNVAATQTFTSAGTITGAGGIIKDGTGRVDLTSAVAGSYDFSGGVTINAGRFNVGAGATLDSDLGVVVNAGGRLGGSGTIDDSVTVNAGGRFAPGSSPGTASVTGPLVWNGGSIQEFDVNDTPVGQGGTGVVGTNWDQILVTDAINGVLTINATSVNPITVEVNPLDPGFTTIANFDKLSTVGYSWLWVTATAGINLAGGDPLASRFVFDDQFVFGAGAPHAPNSGPGFFFVSQTGNSLFINYQAVPEPGSMILLGLAGLGMGAYGWRRRKQGQRAGTGEESPAAEVAPAAEEQA